MVKFRGAILQPIHEDGDIVACTTKGDNEYIIVRYYDKRGRKRYDLAIKWLGMWMPGITRTFITFRRANKVLKKITKD